MELRRVRLGEWIAGVSGVVLFLSLFLPWYELEGRVPASDPFRERVEQGLSLEISAFEAFSVFDVVLVLLSAAGVALVMVIAMQQTAALGVALEAIVTLLAAVAAIALFVRVLDLPGDLEVPAGQPFEAERTAFAWIGVAAAFGVPAGALVGMRDERLSKPGKPTDATGLPVDRAPGIETLPAPPRS